MLTDRTGMFADRTGMLADRPRVLTSTLLRESTHLELPCHGINNTYRRTLWERRLARSTSLHRRLFRIWRRRPTTRRPIATTRRRHSSTRRSTATASAASHKVLHPIGPLLAVLRRWPNGLATS